MSIFESLYGTSSDPFDLYTEFTDTDNHFSLDPPTNFNYLTHPTTTNSHETYLSSWSAPYVADVEYKNEPLSLFENDDGLYDFLEPNFTDSTDDIAPDGILRLDCNNDAGHDGVLYLTNDRGYVAADSHLTESFAVDQPQQPYVASNSHLTVNDMDIYNSNVSPIPEPILKEPVDMLSTFAGLCKSNEWLFSSQQKSPLDSRSCAPFPFQEELHQKIDTNTRCDRFQSRSAYFTSSLRDQQLQRYRDKKLRRVYHRSVDVKRSAQAKGRERNSRGRFVVCR